jgi:hypothetical protein
VTRKAKRINLLAKLLLLAGISVAIADQTVLAQSFEFVAETAPHSPAQRNGMTLSEAVESIRRRGDVERVISAETKVSGGREVHYIRVMTKDGKVQTHKVQGQRRE